MKSIIYNLDHTLYAIKAIMIEDNLEITVGRFGSFSFQKGLYVYVGSAKKNIKSRVERHIKIEKKKRWHFDYLRPFVEIVEVETYSGDEGECQLFQRLMKENNGSIPVQGFGSSDCKSCKAHMFHIQNPIL